MCPPDALPPREAGVRDVSFQVGSAEFHAALGPAAGPPIVLLHGVTRRWQDFLPILPALATAWHVHALDFHGHGRSGREPEVHRVIDYVPEVLAYLGRIPEERVALLGHSLGGMVAAAVAAEAPDRVAGVVLEDPPFAMMGGRIGETMYPPLFAAYRALAARESVEEIAEALAKVIVGRPHSGGPPIALGSLRDAVSLRFAAACLKRLDPRVLDPILAGGWLEGYDVEGVLSRVTCPALFLQGEFAAGGALPDDYAADLAARLPRGLLVRMAGAPHQIHGARPEAMMRLAMEFLESLDGYRH
jgi:pimeloyl-ACP methyl ester carboxylesterase